MTLKIAPDLELPDDVVTQAIAILARKGAGKTYTASVLVEEVVRAKLPVVVLDPTGAWWGLRSSVDGQKPGLPVVIFGGDHADVPLEPTAGKVIADVVLEHPGAFIVDLSGFESKGAEQRFAIDFLERLYRGKKRETGPLLLVVDEADSFAPQRPGPEQTRTLGALEAIVRRGRIKGLGDLLITQRAAVLNKNVLTQTEVLVVMQTTGPQDRAAIDEWIEGNGTKEERAEVLGSLASLERGEAWVWSPSFLRILQRVRIRARTTFDSSRTPEAGETAVTPRAFAEVDLEALGAQIAATVEQQKANDPAELRRRIAALEREVAREQEHRPPEVRFETVEVPVLNGQVGELRQLLGELREIGTGMVLAGTGIAGVADSITAAIERVAGRSAPPAEHQRAPRRALPQPSGKPAATGDAPVVKRTGVATVDRGALTQAIAAAHNGRTLAQVAFILQTDERSANEAVRGLQASGAVDRIEGRIRAVGSPGGLTGRELLEDWIQRLPQAEGLILRSVAGVYPEALSVREISRRTGYSRGGKFYAAIANLQRLDLLERDELRASADLVG